MKQKIRYKICGLRSKEDIALVNEVKPDFAGFIVNVPKSFRSIAADKLKELTKELDKDIQVVGVFVNEMPEVIETLLKENVIDIAQLHGQETPEEICYLKERTGKKIIKAFSIKEKKDVETAKQSPADYILLDQGSGGTGQAFDWSLVGEIERPWFLAGGLSAENLDEAIEKMTPWAVDISSGVETDRKKDPEKVRKISYIIEGRQ